MYMYLIIRRFQASLDISMVGLHIITDFSISIPILIPHFDTDINSIHIAISTQPYYPEWCYSALKSGELPSRAPHTAYCNCLCSNNVQGKLSQSLPGQCSHIKFPHFVGINWYFLVSRVIFCYIIVTFLSNTGRKYLFKVWFEVCHFDTLDRYRVVSIPGSDRVTICSPNQWACIWCVMGKMIIPSL